MRSKFPQADIVVDALIIGGGAVGLTLGISLLQDQTKRIAIVDKYTSRKLKWARAVGISAESLAIFKRIGVFGAVKKTSSYVSGLCLKCSNKVGVEKVVSEVDLEIVDDLHPVLQSQSQTERILEREFQRLDGIIIKGFTFNHNSFMADECFNFVELVSSDSVETKVIQTKWLFGCDGRKSEVRKIIPNNVLLNFGRRDTGLSVDVEFKEWPFSKPVNVWITTWGSGIAVRIDEHGGRVITTTSKMKVYITAKFGEQIQVSNHTKFEINYTISSCYGYDGVWLAGDSAHTFSPVGGQGMNMGIKDAWELSEALKHDKLHEYERKRKAAAYRWIFINYFISWIVFSQTFVASCFRYILILIMPYIGIVLKEKIALLIFDKLMRSEFHSSEKTEHVSFEEDGHEEMKVPTIKFSTAKSNIDFSDKSFSDVDFGADVGFMNSLCKNTEGVLSHQDVLTTPSTGYSMFEITDLLRILPIRK
jgi:2-polyprenyl-6-methoxyphenol hydroxylase-like FAD-dependent oxidoreductase